MPGTVPQPTPIFHITNIDNLSLIVASGALRTIADLMATDVAYTSIAHQSVQDRRTYTQVPCGPGGCLHEYVPYYFGVRSPMLYTINLGNVEGYEQGQEAVIYLVSTVQTVRSANLGYVFTDGHGIMGFTDFYDDLVHLGEVDWPLMKRKYWYDTDDDPDRKRRRQAGFLVHGGFPWTLVEAIVVMNNAREAQVQTLLQRAAHKPPVSVRRDWYY